MAILAIFDSELAGSGSGGWDRVNDSLIVNHHKMRSTAGPYYRRAIVVKRIVGKFENGGNPAAGKFPEVPHPIPQCSTTPVSDV